MGKDLLGSGLLEDGWSISIGAGARIGRKKSMACLRSARRSLGAAEEGTARVGDVGGGDSARGASIVEKRTRFVALLVLLI